jgi:endonuclease/exonuclease/phosphatase family metal-dependent hydrolase
MNLRVLTYNVFGMPWGLQSIESILLWAFYDTDAEILCFQEVFSEAHIQTIQDICSRSTSQWTCWVPDTEPTCLSRLTSYFSSISGLCILVKKHIHILSQPTFEAFDTSSNVDTWVRKGFFHLHCEKEGVPFHLITTHFQSDFTECKCRIRYGDIRLLQEWQLLQYCKRLPNLILVGDFNMSQFRWFKPVNSNLESTLQATGESLDHCLSFQQPYEIQVSCKTVTYHHEIHLSDHTPVVFELRFGQT